MSDPPSITIYTTPQIKNFFKLEEMEPKMGVKVLGHPIKYMLDLFMLEGGERDIIIIPFISNYESLVDKFRQKMCFGPVIFVADIPLTPNELFTIIKKGAIHLNIKRERVGYVCSLIEYLVTALKTKETVQAVEELSLYMGIANQMQGNYLRDGDKHNKKHGVEEAESGAPPPLLLPDPVSLFELVDLDSFAKAVFTFSMNITSQKSGEKHPVYFMARLSHSGVLEYPRKTLILYFYQFHPDFVRKPLKLMAEKVPPEVLEVGLMSEENAAEIPEKVQLSFFIDGIQRNCQIVPQFEDDDRTGFVVLTDAYFQKRRYIRIAPSSDIPLTVITASEKYPTSLVTVIDVSEAGLSIRTPSLYNKDSDIFLSIRWEDKEIVCRGKTRFCGESDRPDQFKVGIELFIHEDEQAMLRKYVFDCQSNIYKALKEDNIL